MPISVKKRDGESASTLIYRFSRRVMQSGVLREVKKRRFHERPKNRNQRRKSALYRARKRAEIEKQRKLGNL